jgi:NAD(P)-dependent dehydrogenase (short-subunit alcohol dehydrogenase family)
MTAAASRATRAAGPAPSAGVLHEAGQGSDGMACRTWFITGASRGLGREMTEQLLARGERVAATAWRPCHLASLREEHPDRLWTACLDVTDTCRVREVVACAFEVLGRIDVVVSNAGYGLCGAAEELSDAAIEREIATNLTGSIQLTRAVLPYLRAQGGGRIVQVSGMGGQWAAPGLSVYHATQWGIEGFFEALIPEVAPFGIEVTLVEPGAWRSNFTGSCIRIGPPGPHYGAGPVGRLHRRLAVPEAAKKAAPGDPVKVATAIIGSADTHPAPKRLTLGSDAYTNVQSALEERLTALQAQRGLALSTDYLDAPVPSAAQADAGNPGPRLPMPDAGR